MKERIVLDSKSANNIGRFEEDGEVDDRSVMTRWTYSFAVLRGGRRRRRMRTYPRHRPRLAK